MNVLGATLRENILLGSRFEPERYRRVIFACALESDISSFPVQILSCNTLQHTATHCNCNTLQHTATHCNTLHHAAPHRALLLCHYSVCANLISRHSRYTFLAATHCNTLQHTATRCNTMQHTATHCNTLQHDATHCNTLHHTAPHCTTLHHTATHRNTLQHTATRCNTLQHAATYCNMLQHAATRCNTPNAFAASLQRVRSNLISRHS